MSTSIQTGEIRIPGAAPPDGLRFRPVAGPQDYEAMVAVYSACAEADGLVERVTTADIENFIRNPVGRLPMADTVIAEIDGRVVGYAWISHRREDAGDEIHIHRGYVHPEWRRRRIGTALTSFFRLRADATPVPGDPKSPRYLQTFLVETEVAAHALFRGLGYRPVRYAFTMVRDLGLPIPVRPLPAGLELRTATRDDFRRIWEAEREAFQDAWGYYPWPEEAFQRFVGFPHYDPSLWRIAWDGDEVAGGVLNYVNDDENAELGLRRGYTEDIFVRRPWRRRGLASALISQSLQALEALGLEQAALGVDAESPTGALTLYTRLGYTTEQTWTTVRRPLGTDPETP